jgi:hypothetical protein
VTDEITFQAAYDQLLAWCRERDFAGHDPFDALNSKLFQASPLSRSKNARFIWTQLVKRSPSDIRSLASVPHERNPKGIALFALAQLAEYRRLKTPKSADAATQLLSDLLSLKIVGLSGAAWGYNFDWQSRHFFAPKGTPTIVPTAFAARALVEASHLFNDSQYLTTAKSVCDFILQDLVRTSENENEICFSYSPGDQTQIFNASLLAAEVLAEVGAATGDHSLKQSATKAARFVLRYQLADGSWTYGTAANQSWRDNFHTAYVLYSLSRITRRCSVDTDFKESLGRGYKYWKSAFFLADGWPKYYHDDPYPADAHAGASAIITFLELRDLDDEALRLAEKVATWTINNLRDKRGFFYYQRRSFYTVKKPYMRWSQAWMLYALSRLLEDRGAV